MITLHTRRHVEVGAWRDIPTAYTEIPEYKQYRLEHLMPNDLPDDTMAAMIDKTWAEGPEEEAPPDPSEIARGIGAVLPDIVGSIDHYDSVTCGVIAWPWYGAPALVATANIKVLIDGVPYRISVQRA